MGTSSSFKGKVGSSLLPNDFNDIDNESNKNEKEYDKKDFNWTTAKTSMSKYISSNGKIGSPKQITRNYIKAAGGAVEFFLILAKVKMLQ